MCAYRSFVLSIVLLTVAGAADHKGSLLDAEAVNNPQLTPEISAGASGVAVVRAQVLLGRAHFSCGEIDGQFGSNLAKAVKAYQNARSLPQSGTVDAATWAALNADQAPALVPYTISEQDVAGPFVTVPPDLMAQAKLAALSYQSPQELLGEKFHANPKLLQALNKGEALATAGEQILVPNVMLMPAAAKAAKVVVSKSQSAVMAYDSNGALMAWFAATIGSEHDPLPVGEWKIEGVQRNPVFHYNSELFWDAHDKEKAEIAPGPNNPVGVVWIDLSKPHYGIHGTPEPSLVGHATSHGCIRLTNWDAAQLADLVKAGTPASLEE
jgi:lipoprotein-anchoring transpeptidase ErfK/SrfK